MVKKKYILFGPCAIAIISKQRSCLAVVAVTQPTLKPRANPAKKDARGGKSAVKKFTSQFHNERTVGAFLAPVVASLL